MKKTGLMLILMGLSLQIAFGMEEEPSKKRQVTSYFEASKKEESNARLKLNATSLKELCLSRISSIIIENLTIDKPLDSKHMIQEVKNALPRELYHNVLTHLRNYTLPIWTKATLQKGEILPEKCINNGNAVAFLDSHFITDPAKCHLFRLEQRRAFAQDFSFGNEAQLIALASTTNQCALANEDELILFNIENDTDKFIPISDDPKAKDGIIFNNSDEQITTLTFCVKGTTLFIGTNQGRCIILNNITSALDHDAPEYRNYFSSPVTAFGCSRDGLYLLATSDEGSMIAAKKKDGYTQKKNVPIELPKDIDVKNILVSPDSKVFACNAGENKCYFYHTLLEKTFCYPELHFFAIDNHNLALAHILGDGVNLLTYNQLDFTNDKCKLVKSFPLPKNTQLLPINNHVNPRSTCLVDTNEDDEEETNTTTCFLKPRICNLDELLINLAVVRCINTLDDVDLLTTLKTNNKTLIKTFKEILGSSTTNLIKKYINTYIKFKSTEQS